MGKYIIVKLTTFFDIPYSPVTLVEYGVFEIINGIAEREIERFENQQKAQDYIKQHKLKG